MYCPNCRANINENAKFCVNCGTNVHKFSSKQTVTTVDKSNILVNLLSLCCVPILGIGLYFEWKDTRPIAAKSALISGLIGFAILFIFGTFFLIDGIRRNGY